MQRTIFLIFLLSTIFVNGQSERVLKPVLGKENNYSKSEFKHWAKALDLLNSINNPESKFDYSRLKKETQITIDSLESGFGPLTEGVGCSWYCGGGPYKITSTSILDDDARYSDENIHDFSLLNGWVPDSKNGIGESVSFHFKPNSPRIKAIIIYNGYLKTKELWKDNSRAKRIKLKFNNKTFAILELVDTTAAQRFEFEPINSKIENKDLVLTLEILDVYEGEKSTDLVLSEVNFDGIDVH